MDKMPTLHGQNRKRTNNVGIFFKFMI